MGEVHHLGLTVADIERSIVFLASDAAANVTGCTIPIDGGAANTIPLDP